MLHVARADECLRSQCAPSPVGCCFWEHFAMQLGPDTSERPPLPKKRVQGRDTSSLPASKENPRGNKPDGNPNLFSQDSSLLNPINLLLRASSLSFGPGGDARSYLLTPGRHLLVVAEPWENCGA